MATRYVMMLLSVGLLGAGMAVMGQEKEADKPAPPREAREGRPGGFGMGMSREVREATMKLRQLVRDYDTEKSDKALDEVKKQLTAIEDLRIKDLEERAAELKAKKEENINQTLEKIKSGEYQKQIQQMQRSRPGQGGGERGRGPGGPDAGKKKP